MNTITKRRRGISLLETLVTISILAAMSIWTMEIVANGRVIQSRARQKVDLLLLAQSEMDRLRATGDFPDPETTRVYTTGEGRSLSEVTVTSTEKAGMLEIDILVTREITAGPIEARLATIVGRTP